MDEETCELCKVEPAYATLGVERTLRIGEHCLDRYMENFRSGRPMNEGLTR